jgi:flagellar assembly factor FliW
MTPTATARAVRLAPEQVLSAMPVRFVTGLIGLPAVRDFDLVPFGPLNVFGLLRARIPAQTTGARRLELVVAAPGALWPDFGVMVEDADATALGLRSAEDAAILVVVTQGQPVEASTATLYAPVVLNRHDGRALQVVPLKPESESPYSSRTPLPLNTA